MAKKHWKTALTVLAIAGPAEAADTAVALQSDLNHVWVIVAAALVLLMQVGFLLLEAGSVRSKNSVNVAQKNLMDFVLSTLVFGAFGFTLMFGASQGGLFGWDPGLLFYGAADEWALSFFVFQLMFCGTAATIMSGAVAERMTINGYLVGALLIGAVIYPVAGHWAWGGLLNGQETPFLAARGFMDFAGSTVVHSVGAWVALAAIIVIGARTGKFDENGKPRVLHGHSPVLATAGALLLWIGWIGFNGGSTLQGGASFAKIVANTMIAGAAGGVALMMLGKLVEGVYRPDATINGLLGGLVGITAGVDVMTPQSAFLIGLLSGGVVFASTWVMENVFKLDDPIGAIPVHGFAGAFGTIAIAFVAPAETLLAGSRAEQALVQVTGVGLVFIWSFGIAFAAFKAFELVFGGQPDGGRGLRVPVAHEREGLNLHEHNAPMGTGILQGIMAELARNHKGDVKAIEIDYGDEAYETSVLFNRIIENISAEREEEEARYQSQRAARMQVEKEITDVMHACIEGDYSQRLPTEGRDGFLLEICQGINNLCHSAEGALASVQDNLEAMANGEFSTRMEGEYKGRLLDIQKAMLSTQTNLLAVVNGVQGSVEAARHGDFSKLIDIEDKQGLFRSLSEGINDLCAISERGLTELAAVLRRVGDGDLTATMSEDYEGRFAEVGAAVGQMNRGIAELTRSISKTAQSVTSTGQNIASLASEINLGSSKQTKAIAVSLDLLASLNEAAKRAADDAAVADRRCHEALLASQEGEKISAELETRFEEIKNATNQIAQSLELVESIALQTRLISLNASVEAARGGTKDGAGHGFKVVAEEVRQLADRSSEAAQDIRSKTTTVLEAVSNGGDLVAAASGMLTSINAALTESTALVAGVAATEKQQQDRVVQVRAHIDGVSGEASENLRMAIQSTELSEELERGAASTLSYLSRFKSDLDRRDLAA